MGLTTDKMLAQIKATNPTFSASFKDLPEGRAYVATCTIDGKPYELSMLVNPKFGDSFARDAVVHACHRQIMRN